MTYNFPAFYVWQMNNYLWYVSVMTDGRETMSRGETALRNAGADRPFETRTEAEAALRNVRAMMVEG